MYDIIKNVIASGRFELADMLKKIDTLWVQGDITEEQRTELTETAREKADPANSYAPLQEQIDNTFAEIANLKTRMTGVEQQLAGEEGGEEPTDPEPTPEEEWPEYVQPTGAHDAYNTGDKVTHNGKHYICQMDGCVWAPDVYPAAWELVDGAESVEKTA